MMNNIFNLDISQQFIVLLVLLVFAFVLGMKVACEVNEKFLKEEREFIDTLVREKNKEIENAWYY